MAYTCHQKAKIIRLHKTGQANSVCAHAFCYIYLVKEGDKLANNPQGNTAVLMVKNSLKTPNGCIIFCECKSDSKMITLPIMS